jgi:Tol biopolymer transport system component
MTSITKCWSPDGRRLLFGRNDTLIAHALDGSVRDQELVRETDRILDPAIWLADGRIVYLSSTYNSTTRREIKMLEPGGSAGRVVVPLGIASDPDVSPDGRWLAYHTSTSTGQQANVVVQAFPGPGPRTQVSAGGGSDPAWSADGRTVYYLKTDTRSTAVFAVDIAAAGALTAGPPRELFRRADDQGCNPTRCYDISTDGPRFLFRDRGAVSRPSVTRMDLVLNWTATLPKGR